MTYKQISENYKKELEVNAEIIKNKMDIFYEENKDKENIGYLLNKKFEDEIDEFKHKYSEAIPKIMVNTIYEIIPYSNSLDVYLSIIDHQQSIYQKILSNLGYLDALEEEQV